MRATFVKQQPEAEGIFSFYFEPAKPFEYTAGQFTELRLPHNNVDERGDKRWFTLSSSPSEDLLCITTKYSPEPSTYKQTLMNLKPGSEVTLAAAMGDFVLPVQTQLPLVFIASGLGITPMRSIVKWLQDTDQERNIRLIHAVSDPAQLVFSDLFTQAAIDYTPLLSEPQKNWAGQTGRLNSNMIYALPGVQDDALVFISGPEGLVEQLHTELTKKGLAQHRLVEDYFPGYPSDTLAESNEDKGVEI